MADSPVRAAVAVHHVMPETLAAVSRILKVLEQAGVERAALMVAAGATWGRGELARLRDFARRGHVLAGHGWLQEPKRHAQPTLSLVSECVQHRGLDEDSIATLISRCHAWFEDAGLPGPVLYVPPRWALGRIRRWRLRELPFCYYENLWGTYDALTDRHICMPLARYHADRWWRVPLLAACNGVSVRCAPSAAHLRLAVHPFDLRLPMAAALRRMLGRIQPVDPIGSLVAGSTREVQAAPLPREDVG